MFCMLSHQYHSHHVESNPNMTCVQIVKELDVPVITLNGMVTQKVPQSRLGDVSADLRGKGLDITKM